MITKFETPLVINCFKQFCMLFTLFYFYFQIKSLQKEYFAINDWKQRPYFIVEVHSEQVKLLPLKEIEKISDYLNECGDVSAAKYYLSFSDPSNLTAVPGWPLRNLLAMVSLLWCVFIMKFSITESFMSGNYNSLRCALFISI